MTELMFIFTEHIIKNRIKDAVQRLRDQTLLLHLGKQNPAAHHVYYKGTP
jgi:hypothetical protein